MSLSEIATMINSMGLPFAYRAFDSPQAPPFICYLYTGNTPEPADNTNYVKIETLVIELYTDNKDFSLESQIETILDANEMIYERDEEWLSDERMQLTTYTMDVFIDPTTTEV